MHKNTLGLTALQLRHATHSVQGRAADVHGTRQSLCRVPQ